MAKKSKEMAPATTGNGVGALAVASTDMMPDYLRNKQGPARGNENVGIEDITIPRIDVIQALSPQRKKQDPAYIEGAEEGMLFNSVTKELYPDSVLIVPVHFTKQWIVWKDRKKGGGFRGAFNSPAEAEAFISTQEDASDLEAVETAQHFVLTLLPGERVEEAMVSMAKSKMKVSRELNSLVRMAGGDRFSRVYELRAVPAQNANGDDYFNFAVRPWGYPSQEVYEKAERLFAQLEQGERTFNADYSDVEAGEVVDHGGKPSF